MFSPSKQKVTSFHTPIYDALAPQKHACCRMRHRLHAHVYARARERDTGERSNPLPRSARALSRRQTSLIKVRAAVGIPLLRRVTAGVEKRREKTNFLRRARFPTSGPRDSHAYRLDALYALLQACRHESLKLASSRAILVKLATTSCRAEASAK